MIRTTTVTSSSNPLIFRDSNLAHQYCQGNGAEIGAAAHNPFRLPGCVNVADAEGFEFYKQSQVDMCGMYAEADYFADAAHLPFEDQSLDYVISSHMLEHHPNPMRVITEWWRVVKDGGIIFTIVPKRDALPADLTRPITDFDVLSKAFVDGLTVETAPIEGVPGGKGGHYYVYDLPLLKRLFEMSFSWKGSTGHLELLEAHETDDKVGNGHLLVHRVVRFPAPEAAPSEDGDAPAEEVPEPPVRKPVRKRKIE